MEATRRQFVAGSAAAVALAGTVVSSAMAEAAAEGPEGYSFYETETGLQVTVSDNENPELPTVVVLATGGTIAGVGAAGKATGYQAGQLDVSVLVDSAAGITEVANVRGVQVCNVGSDDITEGEWLTIAKTINELAQDPAISGFAITHGTDTLEETAYFLNLVVKTEKPVVLTGAMRPATATSADGPMNLYQTIALAASPEAVGRGTMVVFSDNIVGGRDVQKVNTFQTDAFNGKDNGCMGVMCDGVPFFYNQSTKLHTVNTEFDVTGLDSLPKVEVAYFHIDADPGVLDYYVESGAQAIIIAGAGAGSCSGLWSEKANEICDAGIPVVRCSRISNGLIPPHEGRLSGNNLPPQKAFVLMRLALTVTTDFAEIQDMLDKY